MPRICAGVEYRDGIDCAAVFGRNVDMKIFVLLAMACERRSCFRPTTWERPTPAKCNQPSAAERGLGRRRVFSVCMRGGSSPTVRHPLLRDL
jgi:hypothetical protein